MRLSQLILISRARAYLFSGPIWAALTNANLFFDGLDYTTVDVEDVAVQ